MSLSITQQNVKGGGQALFVRDGRVALMTFPLTMRALAQDMCLEGNELDEEQYPGLIKKYRAKVDAQEKLSATHAPVQHLRDVITPISMGDSAALRSALAAEKARVDELAKNKLPKTMPVKTPKPPDDLLVTLLTDAREAEIELVFRKGEYVKAKNEMAKAEELAKVAWTAFNEALRLSLPEGTRVKGISISTGFIEALESFVQGKGEEE